MQPTYLPWCGYFDLIDSVDHFVFLDNVKLEKSDWHVRNRIKSANGALMLTINVTLPNGRMGTMIDQAKLNLNNPWRKKHLKSIYANYKKSPYFDEIYTFLEPLILVEQAPLSTEKLSTFNTQIIKVLANALGIKTTFHLASELPNLHGIKDQRIVSICQKLAVSDYLSPVGAADYIERNTPGGEISKAGINLSYQAFNHPIYSQLYGEFISHLSVVDMLFNCGFEQSIDLIRDSRTLNKK